ncbi:DUF4844 domain-containing protein [Shewanella sp. KCT]|uniref:DUF4844 domain-containing protein n=1 Tax=Shewanella sp. KCT TaxID=2569535 RepID=UPI001183A2E4|nr:DUF4844 domain-containing protein [Shewanella sp. KCT]TVP14334.1 hypothetical protein AYI87_10890 [Shewanella sp. KCT]
MMRLKQLWCLALIFLLTSCGTGDKQALEITDSAVIELQDFLAQKKFIEDSSLKYPRAPDESVRASAEKVINDLTSRLIIGIPDNPTKAYVLGQFKLSLSQLESYDSEERDRALSYLESIMDILSIQSSDGLLNDWRYGFES